MIHYIFVIKTIFAQNLIKIIIREIMMREIIQFYDLFSSIVIDKNFVFTFKYNDALCYVLKIKYKLSIVFFLNRRINKTSKQYYKITFFNLY